MTGDAVRINMIDSPNLTCKGVRIRLKGEFIHMKTVSTEAKGEDHHY